MAALYAAVDMNTLAGTFGRPEPKPHDSLDSLDIVKALLAHGADPNAPAARRRSWSACTTTATRRGARRGLDAVHAGRQVGG